ncbi:hypothetical protein H2248_002745 [Termitomyces sp. 'cryptogamus']|nr:hypothetical protein H2248_002745 [Termitomyces sp. 'cryptogamus']
MDSHGELPEFEIDYSLVWLHYYSRMSSRAFKHASRPISVLSSIIYSDKGCIVLQKPPGLTCQLSKSKEATGDSLNHFNALLKGLGRTFGKQPVPVHRLDKGTTGALVLGRSSTHARNLSQQFQTRTVEKTYLALVRGGVQTFPTKCGEIRTPIHYKDGRASIDHSSNGKPSITEWEVVSSSPSAPLTLLRLKLHTGHKHQLRVHLAFCLGGVSHFHPLCQRQAYR